MISYGNLTSHMPDHLQPVPIEIGRAAIHLKNSNTRECPTGDELLRIVLATISNPGKWNDVCEALVTMTLADYAILYPVEGQPGTLSYAFGNFTSDCFANPQLVLHLLAKPPTGFVGDDCFLNHPPLQSQANSGSAATLLLNFGLDGIWLLRVGCRNAARPTAAWDPKPLKAWEASLLAVAKTSGRCFKTALRARKNFHTQLNIAFAGLDANGRLLSSNAAFDKIYGSYFHLLDGVLFPKNPGEATAFHRSLFSLSKKMSSREIPLCNDFAPCVGTLRLLPESHARVSRSMAIGLTLNGVAQQCVPAPTSLSWIFGLTKREADITSQMAIGKNVTLIAAQHGVSVATVRFQVKTIFRKLKVNSQLELAVKILGCRV